MSDIAKRDADPDFAESLRGFASMFRSNAYGPEDAGMVAEKFDAAADALADLQAKLDATTTDLTACR